jgi:hypothetical protein
MATRWDEQQHRYVADCETLPDHTTNAVPARHRHEFFLRRDLHTGAPKEAVVWAVWMGAFAELHTWPWTADGLAQAQAWCNEHSAIWSRTGYPVQPGELGVHATAT